MDGTDGIAATAAVFGGFAVFAPEGFGDVGLGDFVAFRRAHWGFLASFCEEASGYSRSVLSLTMSLSIPRRRLAWRAPSSLGMRDLKWSFKRIRG